VADEVTSAYHEAHLVPEPARRIAWQAIARHLQSWIPAQAAVLEIGAGYCDWVNSVKAARRVAIDIWPELPRHTAPGVEPLVLDIARDLGTLTAGSFDTVLASNVFEHFAPDVVPTVVADVARVLKPGGRLLIVQPNFRLAWRAYFDDYTHRSIFTDVSLPALLRAQGLSIDLVQPRFMPYSMRHSRLPITSWLVTLYLKSPLKPMAGQMLVVAAKR
jgi:cyclopropane fatty-acyl-phospholipid synthase-like methyltransferase